MSHAKKWRRQAYMSSLVPPQSVQWDEREQGMRATVADKHTLTVMAAGESPTLRLCTQQLHAINNAC